MSKEKYMSKKPEVIEGEQSWGENYENSFKDSYKKTGNLDWKTGQGIAELLLQFNQEDSVALIVVTHNQRLAEKMSSCTEIIDGKIQSLAE